MSDFKIFIDESCHLEHDNFTAMCIGYVKINTDNYETYYEDIKAIKSSFKTPMEIKWSNISQSRLPLYYALIDYFFSNEIDFRCILVKYKQKLDHTQFNAGDASNFYYKMVYFLLNSATNPNHSNYYIYLDVQNTRGVERIQKIETIFDKKHKGESPFVHFQHIHSENVFTQLVDLFIGAIAYKARQEHLRENSSAAKKELIHYIEKKSGYSLDEGTPPWETKFNIFDHQPKSTGDNGVK